MVRGFLFLINWGRRLKVRGPVRQLADEAGRPCYVEWLIALFSLAGFGP